MACSSRWESSAAEIVRPSAPAKSFSDRDEAIGLGSLTDDGSFPPGSGTGLVAFGWAGVVIASPSSDRTVALRPALVLVGRSPLRGFFCARLLSLLGMAIPPPENHLNLFLFLFSIARLRTKLIR